MLQFFSVKIFGRILAGLCLTGAAFYWLGPPVVNALFEFQETRDEISRIVREKTGRELRLDGEIYFRFRGLTPGLRLTRVRFQNAAWARHPDMLRLGYLDVDLRIVQLLFDGQVDLSSVELGEGELFLETDRTGRGNWEFAASASTQPAPGSPPAKSDAGSKSAVKWFVEDLRVIRSKLNYTDGETGRIRVLDIDRSDLRIDAEKIAGNIAVRYGASDVSGKLQFRIHPRKITAKLNSRSLDIDDFIDREKRVRREARARRRLPRPAHEPLPFDELNAADVGLEWRLSVLRRGAWRINNLALTAELRDGKLDVESLRGAFANGTFDASAHIRSRERAVDLDARIQKIDLTQILRDARERPLADTNLSARIRLASSGVNLPALRGNLKGALAFESGALSINEPVFYAAIGSEAASAVKSWATPLPRVECLIARLDISAGRGVARTLLLDANELSVLGAGTVDLAVTGENQLNLIFALHSKHTSVFSLAANLPVHLRGSFAHPVLKLSDADIAKKIFLSVLQLPLLPADFIASIYDRGIKPGHSLCPAAREKAYRGFEK